MYVNKVIPLRVLIRFAWKPILIFIALAFFVVFGYKHISQELFSIPFLPVGTLGTAVAILLGFRNNSAYDRFWEARKIWGQLVNDSRSFTRQVLTIPEDKDDEVKKRMIHRHLAFINALRMHLRQEDIKNVNCWYELRKYMTDEDFIGVHESPNKPTFINFRQGEDLKLLKERKAVDSYESTYINHVLDRFYDIQGKCERIKNTPLPRQYAFFTTLFTRIFVALLPFGFVEELGWYTIPLSVLISWIFNTLEQVGTYTENPFDNGINDVSMTAICISIERDLRFLCQEDKPEPQAPVKGVLM